MAILAVGFDIDGTLYPASALYLRMLPASLRHLGLLKAFRDVRHELRELNPTLIWHQRLPESIAEFHNYQAALTAKRLGWTTEQAKLAIDDFFYGKSSECFNRIPLFADVTRVLTNLQACGLALGALSDFPCDRKLQLMGLAGHFDVIMTSEETGLVKPDRASFDLLARRLGVPNAQILYVGNSEAYDVVGAKAAGMQTALISASSKTRNRTEADFAFSSFRDLESYIFRQTGRSAGRSAG
jgi:putative hydrolase of the HAD superfamily